jgi:hypothetical protein
LQTLPENKTISPPLPRTGVLPRIVQQAAAGKPVADTVAVGHASANVSARDESGHSISICWRRRAQRVIANRSAHPHADMDNGNPALDPMVAGAVKKVGDANRCRRARQLDPHKKRAVVHDGIAQQPLIHASAPHIACRSIIKHPCGAHAEEEPSVLPVPEAVRARITFRTHL